MASDSELFVFEKDPEERFPMGVDFATRLPDATIIESALVSAVDVLDNSNASSLVLSGAAFTDTQVAVVVKDGIDGSRYKIMFKATLTNGYVLKEAMNMDVVAL